MMTNLNFKQDQFSHTTTHLQVIVVHIS